MTLEEGIVHAEDVARMNHEAAKHLTDEHPTQAEKCEVCAEEHRQLAEWLKELKVYKYNESNGGLVEALMHSEAENERLHDELKAYRANTCDDAVSRAIVQEEITKSIELKENPYQLWYRIRALPSVTPQPCDDAISRQEAKRAIEALQRQIMREESNYYQFKFSGMSEAREAVVNLPSVTPQQRIGRWIDSHIPESTLCECSECGFTCGAYSFNYCPDCGAKMESEDEE